MKSIEELVKASKAASFKMAVMDSESKNNALVRFSQLLIKNSDELLAANKKDLDEQKNKISSAMYQRLKLDQGKINILAKGILDIAQMEEPVGKKEWVRELDKDLILTKRSVPIGVVGIIFESRPDVIPQILSLTLKSSNVTILKGGREAIHSNRAFIKIAEQLTTEFSNLPENWVTLVESREEIAELLKWPQYIDLIIPRGSNELVSHIMKNTQIPVLGHADGVCHVYVDEEANLKMALDIVIDAKTQYPAVCNAMETLLIHQKVAATFAPQLAKVFSEKGVLVHCCDREKTYFDPSKAVENWRTEFGELECAVKIVDSIEEAIEHINQWGSHHTDCIVTANLLKQNQFLASVDSASVVVNASTRFGDGFRYGFGAEIGISTNKTHARGPVGIEGLLIYKYELVGSGHVVKDYVGESAKPFTHKML